LAQDNGTPIGWFIGGALLGAAVALLMAPKSGDKFRQQISESAEKGGKSLLQTGQELFERGRDLFEKGREIADEAADIFEKTRRIAERKIEDAV
jgi:gas vesicle protein